MPAPLHHFHDHHGLLSAYVAQQWIAVAERMKARRERAGANPYEGLRAVGMAYIESGMRTPGLFGLLLRPDLCPQPGSEEFERGSKPACEELIQAVRACSGGSEHDAALSELAWSAVHGFVELQLLMGVTDWEPQAQAMLDRMAFVFLRNEPRE
jgi:AcrR family transcriptional regulator